MTEGIRLRDLFARRVRGATTAAWSTLGGGALVGGHSFATANVAGVIMGLALIGAGLVALRDVQRVVEQQEVSA